jgi:ferredoxin-type protein NapH
MLVGALTYPVPLQREPAGHPAIHLGMTLLISAIPFVLLVTGRPSHRPRRAPRPRIVHARILVQCVAFVLYAAATSYTFIRGDRIDLIYWAVFHVLTVALLPFLIGRALCSWLCPNATLQDGLIRFMTYRRPIERLPRAVEEQSRTCAMNVSGEVDKAAPLLPATLLLCWFPMFFVETVFELTAEKWYPVVLMYGLFLLSFLMPWRKLCTHFCWLSSYRGIAGHGSLWRLRFNRDRCRDCKRCPPERECPFHIDIRDQEREMPASCAVCFSCMEACPYEGVITLRRPRDTAAPAAEERPRPAGAPEIVGAER